MRIIIAGGRDFNNYELLKNKCNGIIKFLNPDNIEIISGAAKGADSLGAQYAKENNYKLISMPANWNLFGKQAGYLRNIEMAKKAIENDGVLILFWDKISRGSKHMLDVARGYNMKIFIIQYEMRKKI